MPHDHHQPGEPASPDPGDTGSSASPWSSPAPGTGAFLRRVFSSGCQVLTSREAWLTRALTDLIDEREHRVLDEAVGLLNRLVEYEPDTKTMR
jgi:hypothetical protein